MIEVLGGQGFVELVDHMGDDLKVVRAARVSYGGDEDWDQDDYRDKKLLKYLLKNKHTSPFEHVAFTFHAKVPIFVARQWMRHRTHAYNEVSGRYTVMPDEWYIPDEWRAQSKGNKQMSDGLIPNQVAAQDEYGEATELAFRKYHYLLELGVSREMARMVLPLSTFTRYYDTVNLHNLLHFLSLRDHEHAQPEIVEYAQAMRKLIKPIVPWTAEIVEELSE